MLQNLPQKISEISSLYKKLEFNDLNNLMFCYYTYGEINKEYKKDIKICEIDEQIVFILTFNNETILLNIGFDMDYVYLSYSDYNNTKKTYRVIYDANNFDYLQEIRKIILRFKL